MKPKNPKDELSELLGTSDRQAQSATVRRLLAAPVVELVIRLDGRTNQVSFNVIGGQLPPEAAYAMLDGCRELIRRQELEAVQSRPNGGAPEKA